MWKPDCELNQDIRPGFLYLRWTITHCRPQDAGIWRLMGLEPQHVNIISVALCAVKGISIEVTWVLSYLAYQRWLWLLGETDLGEEIEMGLLRIAEQDNQKAQLGMLPLTLSSINLWRNCEDFLSVIYHTSWRQERSNGRRNLSRMEIKSWH